MSRRPKPKSKTALIRWVQEALLPWLRSPKAAFYFVVLCLFLVVVNGAIVRQSAWPLEESSSKQNAVEIPQQAVPSQKSIPPWSYFHPNWRETPDLNGMGRPKFHPDSWSLSEASLRNFLADPRHKLSREFQVPPALQERVLFWMRIHTQYNGYMRVIHDRNTPSIIYGVIDFTPLRQTRTDAGIWNRMWRIEQEIQKELKARLREAAGLAQTHNLSPWERNELRALLSQIGRAHV